MARPSEHHLSLELCSETNIFQPGDTLRLQVVWSLDRCRSIEIDAGWFAEGNGQQDVMSYCTESFRPEQPQGQHEFSFKLPRGPLSCERGLFSIYWVLEAHTKDGKYHSKIPIVLGRE